MSSLHYLPDVIDGLSPQEKSILTNLRKGLETDVMPHIHPYLNNWEFPHHMLPKMEEWGIQGGNIKGYGSAQLSNLATGLVTMELYRVDPSLGTFYAVSTGVGCLTISLLGTTSQKDEYLP